MSGLDIIAVPEHSGMFARRVAVEAWQAAGSPRVNSAGRLYATQKYLYDGWRAGRPGFSPADNPDSETQRLAHVRFVAFDIDATADRIRRLTGAGFIRPYSYEPWHWELPNVRSYSLVRSIPAVAGGGITIIEPTPTQRGAIDMPMLYGTTMPSAVAQKFRAVNAGLAPGKPTYMLLGGSPGTPLNAAITQDQVLASQWAKQLAPTLDNPSEVIIPASWGWADQMWDQALAPLRIDFTGLPLGGSGGTFTDADRARLEAVPTAQQNGSAARTAIIK